MSAASVAIPRLGRQRVTALVLRAIPAAAFVWACLTLFGHAWRAAEAGSVVLALHLLGVRNAHHLGDQILVASPGGATFLTNIEPWCSSLAIVATFAAVAAVATTAPRRRIRAVVVGAGIVMTCNLIRMLATVLVGVWARPGEIEPFHDGIATGFAVLFVLSALAAFVSILWPPRPSARRAGGATRGNDRPARASAGISRRQAIGAGLAAIVVVEAVPQLTFAGDRKPTFALDPTRLGTCPGGCENCRACIAHGANKLFSSKGAGDARRAHPGCRCAVVPGESLSAAVWDKVFQAGPAADRRNPTTQTFLRADVEQHAVPLVNGRLPLIALVGGAAAVLIVNASRRREPAAPDESPLT